MSRENTDGNGSDIRQTPILAAGFEGTATLVVGGKSDCMLLALADGQDRNGAR